MLTDAQTDPIVVVDPYRRAWHAFERRVRFAFARDAFEQWLRDGELTRIVGWSISAERCPLAEWCRARGYVVMIGMMGDTPAVRTVASGWVGPLPRWAARFMVSLDEQRKGPVTAQQCLAVLARVPDVEPSPYVAINSIG